MYMRANLLINKKNKNINKISSSDLIISLFQTTSPFSLFILLSDNLTPNFSYITRQF